LSAASSLLAWEELSCRVQSPVSVAVIAPPLSHFSLPRSEAVLSPPSRLDVA
jgi:hypothetical protein